MESLDITKLKRNSVAIDKKITVKNKLTIANKKLSILIPEKYVQSGLAFITDTIKTVSVYAILDTEDNYSVINIPISTVLTPSSIENIDINGDTYIMAIYEEGDSLFTTNDLVEDDGLLYSMFNYFIMGGNIPFYMEYEDLGDLMVKSKEYTGRDIGSNPITLEILSSILARDPDQQDLYYRLSKMTKSPVYKGLNNQFHVFDNTTSKLVGSYFSDGVVTSLVDKSLESTNIEEIIKA